MDNALSFTLEAQQTQAHFQDVLNRQAVGMYEQSPRKRYVPAAYTSAFISKSIADLDADIYEQRPPAEAFQWTDERLMALQRSYAFLSSGVLIADVLAQVPALYPLLNAAIEPLRVVFGKSTLLQLEALASDDDSVLRVIAKLSWDAKNPAALMRKFKLDWWFKNCSRSEASLIFDYEIGNVF